MGAEHPSQLPRAERLWQGHSLVSGIVRKWRARRLVVVLKPWGGKRPSSGNWPEVSASSLTLAYLSDFTICARGNVPLGS